MSRFAPVLALGLALISADAVACSRDPSLPEPTTEDLFNHASAVFLAHVTKAEEVRAPDRLQRYEKYVVDIDFRVIEIFKGSPPQRVRSFVSGPGNCTIPVLAGWDYLLMLPQASDGFVGWPQGSREIPDPEGAEAKRLFETLRALKN